jgi:hypothetical protein
MYLILLLHLAFPSVNAHGQPSSQVDFYFRLFDHQGNRVNYSMFCDEFQLLGETDDNDETSCTNKNIPQQYTYNDTTGYFNGFGTVVYNDLTRRLIHKNDTMTLILITHHGRSTTYKIDSLFISPGKYVVADKSLKFVDFKAAEVDYYNWVIERATLRNQKIVTPELNRLKRKYHISPDDFKTKKVGDIFKK